MGASPAAIGCRSHTGWAVVVVVTGSATSEVLERLRVELLDGSLPAHPYHEAAETGMSIRSARSLIGKVEAHAAKSASAALVPLAATVEHGGHAVAGIAVVTTERLIPDELERVLRSHQLLHAAEGDLYEEALVEAASSTGRAVARVERSALFVDPNVGALGRAVGPPWQKDHKLAAMAAFTLLR
jgi:hypothetical protein